MTYPICHWSLVDSHMSFDDGMDLVPADQAQQI